MAAQHDDPPAGMLALIGASSLIVTLVTVILTIALYRGGEAAEFERKVVQVPYTAVETMRSEQNGHLGAYGWVDRESGQVHIPIDRAVSLLLKEHKAR